MCTSAFAAVQGKSLASVTVIGDPECSDRELESRVRGHLAEWFAPREGDAPGAKEGGVAGGTVSVRRTDVARWRHLRTYRVPYAQPAQTPPVGEGGFFARKAEVRGVFNRMFTVTPAFDCCWDHPTDYCSFCHDQ